jgi:hypothetical protein
MPPDIFILIGGYFMPEAKIISKIFKIVSAVGIAACAILKWVGVMPGATITEICAVWSVIYGLGAGTIDINLMLEKFSKNKEE